jgi:hypothetical protein
MISQVKRPGREADHSPPSSAEIENAWSYTSTPQYVFMARCLVKHRDNFTFTLSEKQKKRFVHLSNPTQFSGSHSSHAMHPIMYCTECYLHTCTGQKQESTSVCSAFLFTFLRFKVNATFFSFLTCCSSCALQGQLVRTVALCVPWDFNWLFTVETVFGIRDIGPTEIWELQSALTLVT